MDRGEWEELAEGMTGFGWSGRGEQTSPLCPLEVVEPIGPCSLPHPSHALSCGGPCIVLCLLIERSAFLGFGPLRVCEGLFPLLPRVGTGGPGSFLREGLNFWILRGPAILNPFGAPPHVFLALPVCPELLVGPWRDLDSTPDLNI